MGRAGIGGVAQGGVSPDGEPQSEVLKALGR